VTPLLPNALNLLVGSGLGPIQRKTELPDLFDSGSPHVFSFCPSAKLAHRLSKKGYKYFRYFAAVPSQNAPRWVLPLGASGETLAAARIYLPYRRVARILKRVVVRMINAGCDGWLRSRILIASKEPLPLEELVREVTGEERPIFALSLGRQAAVRKLTVQVISPKGATLGYLKFPLTDKAVGRVRHEAAILERLGNFPSLRPHIPRILYAGSWNDSYMLFQTSLEGEVGPLTLGHLHDKFLHTLRDVHTLEKPGQHVVDDMAARWKNAAQLLGGKWKELGAEVLRRSARELQGKMLRCGVMHGDFAPWNTRARAGELLLFDWESADWEAPLSWDLFHFGVQTASSFNKNGAQYLLSSPVPPATPCFMLYLLSTTCQFLEEQNYTAIGVRENLLLRELHNRQRTSLF
jgi:Phosphotransferase enzyme family